MRLIAITLGFAAAEFLGLLLVLHIGLWWSIIATVATVLVLLLIIATLSFTPPPDPK